MGLGLVFALPVLCIYFQVCFAGKALTSDWCSQYETFLSVLPFDLYLAPCQTWSHSCL